MGKDVIEMDPAEEFLSHYGVKGMHWGIRRDPNTGVRPIAKALDSSRFGRMANANAEKRMSKQRSSAWYKSRGLSNPNSRVSRVLDDLDIPGRPNRRSNTMSDAQKRRESPLPVKVGIAAVGAILAVQGARTIRAIRQEYY
jgi:hypothetical protein